MAKTVQQLAEEASKYFEHKTRDSGERYVAMKEDRPEWVYELVYAAHQDMLPDDWKFAFVEKALDILAETEDTDEARDQASEPDIYNHDLLQWFGSHAHRWGGYVEDALDELGGELPKEGGIIGLIQYGQARERGDVFDTVLRELQDLAENEQEEEASV